MPTEIRTFRYGGPNAEGARDRGPTRGKSYDMITNDVVISTVQVMEKGVGNTLHYHNDEDGYWLVLGGRARFYGVDGQVLADLGKHEGVFVPRFTRYWFESVADEPLEILRVSHHGATHAEGATSAKDA
jgi:mannose-6-phosphate isomerase-like protein (cupin superfamily)